MGDVADPQRREFPATVTWTVGGLGVAAASWPFVAGMNPPQDVQLCVTAEVGPGSIAPAFTGYLLPWGQMSCWGAQVTTNRFRATPFIGDQVVVWLQGDDTVGDATLARFFAPHCFFPFLIMGSRITAPVGITLRKKQRSPGHQSGRPEK